MHKLIKCEYVNNYVIYDYSYVYGIGNSYKNDLFRGFNFQLKC